MKKIILQSKLSEDEALAKLGEVSKDLLSKGLISKGDEIVAGVEEKDGVTIITINADLMTKEKYKSLKQKFLEVGKILENDLKNFDEEEEKKPEDKSEPTKESEGEDKDPKNTDDHEKQKAVDQNSVKPAEAVLHDTSELLFDINPNQKEMDDLKTLLFSEEEINKAPKSPEERPADPKAEEQKPEEKEHDDPKGEEDKKEGEEKKPEEKDHEDPNPEETHEEKLHDLLFSDEELNEGLELHDLLFSDEELSEKKSEEKKEMPFDDREAALKELAQYRKKAAEGKELTVAEKFFCDAASKHFSDEEVAAVKVEEKAPEVPKGEEKKPEVKEHDDKKCFKVLCKEGKLIKDGFESEEAAKKFVEEGHIEGAQIVECKEHDDKPADPKPEEKKEEKAPEAPKNPDVPKADPKPEEKKEETKMELIRRLNRENSGNTLLGRAKEVLKSNK